MSRFQLIFTGILVVLGIGGAIAFSISKNTGSQGATQVVMWGTISSSVINPFISNVVLNNRDTVNVSYVEKTPVSLESELIAALARGTGPDMILLPQDLIVKQLDKYYQIPYSTYSARTFKDSFIPEGELYLGSSGVIGFPFSVDPMVMYWNRDIFSNAGIAAPPTTWSQFFTLAPKLTVKDDKGNITQSAVALGEARNILHFKDMIALLSLQAGTPITTHDSQGVLSSVFDMRGTSIAPAEEALSYFTEFSNPAKTSYSWNRSLPTDRTDFIAGKLAVYFGYASELAGIRQANPNLNFDVTGMPQTEGNKMTFGAMNAITILNASANKSAAYTAASILTSAAGQKEWVTETGYPPVRRDLLTSLPGDAYQAVFWRGALIANGWLDPNREATVDVFGRLIENVTSGKLRVSESVHSASQELDMLIQNAQ